MVRKQLGNVGSTRCNSFIEITDPIVIIVTETWFLVERTIHFGREWMILVEWMKLEDLYDFYFSMKCKPQIFMSRIFSIHIKCVNLYKNIYFDT